VRNKKGRRFEAKALRKLRQPSRSGHADLGGSVCGFRNNVHCCNTRRNLLPKCYQNMASGLGAESWGIGPFTVTLKR